MDKGLDKNESNNDKNDIDYILEDVGEFSKYQIGHFILMILPIVLSASYAVEFIVTGSTDEYRCRIPECDGLNATTFNHGWLENAIPLKNNRPEKCSRYAISNLVHNHANGDCPKSLFNETNILHCDQFIFKTNEHRIMQEFNILCDENEYKLALVGTINNIGGFLFMPLTGVLSDKFGRLTVLSFSMFGASICGLIKAFVNSYTLYMFFEFLGAAIGTCCYMATFVLCVEWVSSKYRILSGTIIAVIYPLGEILIGVAAIYLSHYRHFLLAIYTPALIIIFYFWFVPESVRWLIVIGQYNKALRILKRTAKQNNKTMSDKSMEILKNHCYKDKNVNGECNSTNCNSLKSIFLNKLLIMRLITCSLCWIMTVFLFYGLSVNATKITDDNNKYLSYIITMIAEAPAAIITYFLLKYIGRRTAMCTGMCIAGIATIISTFVPTNSTFIIRIVFFIGMCATSSSFAVLYVFSAEIWPTNMRNTLMNICSMIGRFGSMLAPLAILLGQIIPTLPLLIFGGTGLICGCIIFLLPETKDKKLPDTIEDACRL